MRRRKSSSCSCRTSTLNVRISVAVSTVAMLTSRSSGRLPDRRGPSHYGDARRTSSRPSHYGDAANDPTPTLSDPPLRINAVHQIDTGNAFELSAHSSPGLVRVVGSGSQDLALLASQRGVEAPRFRGHVV